MASIGDMVVRIVGDITALDKALGDAEKRFKSSTETMAKIGKSLTTFVTLPILAIGAAAVKSAADMEMQQAAFETMLGSASKAEAMLKDLAKFAAATPFQLPDLAKGAKTMLAFGIEAEKILPNLKQLGDIAQHLAIGPGIAARDNGHLPQAKSRKLIICAFIFKHIA
jgi:hypothetical protein